MDDEEEQQKLPDLVKALVHHLLSQNLPPNSPPLNPTSSHFQNSLRYAHRILSSHLTPSVTPDAAAIAESIKRRLATEGRSSEALSFADLYTKFVSKAADVDNKWALLHLFNIISQDHKTAVKSQLDASVFLPNLTISDNNVGPRRIENKGWSDGVVVLAKDPNNRRDIAFHEYVKLVKEENDVTEEAMVTDVLYACQGVDGKYVKFDNDNNCYVLLDSIRVSRGTTGMVYRLCELGVLFKKVIGYIEQSLGRFQTEDVGTVGQAFCSALQNELSDYYKLLAVLEAHSSNPIPLFSESASSVIRELSFLLKIKSHSFILLIRITPRAFT